MAALLLKNYILLMGVFISMSSCKRNDSGNVSFVSAQEYINVSYGKDTAQKMDVYLPANRNTDSTKLIILIHGGAWMEGDKKDFSGYISSLKKRLPDYAFANINYRLATQTSNHFPAQENDVQAAVAFLNNNRTQYGISDKFVLLGASAGAHLALLHAYKHTSPVSIKAVISFFGPADLKELYNTQSNSYYQLAFQTLIGGRPVENATAYEQSSPIYFANAQSCPTLLLQGGRDMLVAPAQSIALKNKLTTAGVAADLVLYPAEGHGWSGANLENSFDRIKTFLELNVF
jgi:acetyl esterase/lipase